MIVYLHCEQLERLHSDNYCICLPIHKLQKYYHYTAPKQSFYFFYFFFFCTVDTVALVQFYLSLVYFMLKTQFSCTVNHNFLA